MIEPIPSLIAEVRSALQRLAFLEVHRGHNDREARAAIESLNEFRRLTYDKTPVDCLLSDLAVTAMLDALDPDEVLDRIKEFGTEVGTLDAEGKPVV